MSECVNVCLRAGVGELVIIYPLGEFAIAHTVGHRIPPGELAIAYPLGGVAIVYPG